MSKATIYELHDAAFAQVSAWVVMQDGHRVATVALKYPRDGAGRLFAYVHWLGWPMVRGYASGGGYDKATAACAAAASKLSGDVPVAFLEAMLKDGGYSWEQELTRAGFQVWQAV